MKVLLTDFTDFGDVEESDIFLGDGGKVVVANVSWNIVCQVAEKSWSVTSGNTADLYAQKLLINLKLTPTISATKKV